MECDLAANNMTPPSHLRPNKRGLSQDSPVRHRNVSAGTRLLLAVRAGGRCEFDGCNKYLFAHFLTGDQGNFSAVAHVVAFSARGPRGTEIRPESMDAIENLMLLCADCHKLIDDNPDKFTVVTLRLYKERHEERISHVTGLGPDLKTTVVQLKATIGGHAVAIPANQVTEAVAPRYPTDTRGYVIDLTGIRADSHDSFVQLASHEIALKIRALYEPGMDVETTRHISLFALAPIPVLVFLGSQLSNKVPIDLYQRHRDTENWVWKTDGSPVSYQMRKWRQGSDPLSVALVLSLSGTIHAQDLPQQIGDKFSVYEITLATGLPNPNFLRRRVDLEEFKTKYQECLRHIRHEHPSVRAISLFPAIPAPIAVVCGRELLPKVDPELRVYDYDKSRGGFTLKTVVNPDESK